MEKRARHKEYAEREAQRTATQMPRSGPRHLDAVGFLLPLTSLKPIPCALGHPSHVLFGYPSHVLLVTPVGPTSTGRGSTLTISG